MNWHCTTVILHEDTLIIARELVSSAEYNAGISPVARTYLSTTLHARAHEINNFSTVTTEVHSEKLLPILNQSSA